MKRSSGSTSWPADPRRRGLEEREEGTAASRKEFLASVRMNLKSQLDNIDILNKDGSVENLGEKYGQKLKEKGN